MIVVPTEKQFDWRYTPVVLFVIVLLNVFFHFIYQSGDQEKYQQAFQRYHEAEFLNEELPLFKAYLLQRSEQKKLSELEEIEKNNQQLGLAQHILIRPDFFEHLQTVAKEHFKPEFYDRWKSERPAIQTIINDVSYLAHGLSAANFKYSALITHQFLHGGIMHLLGNMFFLVICGFAVEAAIGHWRFLLFYLIGGVAAGMAQVASDWNSATPLVGASGSISAVMAMYLAVFRLRKIEFFYWIFFFVGYFRAPALLLLPVYIGKELYSYQAADGSNIAFLAHAGGFVAGAILIGASLLLDKKTINHDYVENKNGPLDEARRQLADIYNALENYRFSQAFTLVNQAMKKQGETFELAWIRHNLLKIGKGKAYIPSILRLWQMRHVSDKDLERLESLWMEHPELHDKLSEEQLADLGIRLSSLHNPLAAEHICDLLEKRGSGHPSFQILAQKLANAFANLGQHHKKNRYTALAQSLVHGGTHGIL